MWVRSKMESYEKKYQNNIIYVLKCFVLIDLKLDKLTYQDIGQMDFYVRYYDNKNLFASKYQLYLPTEELAREIEKQKEEFEDKKQRVEK